jgi:hypothetical protein
MGKNLPRGQKRGLATKTCPPNIKQFDVPPTKKAKAAQLAPEFHIAVNLAPTPGGPALQATCVVSDSPFPQAASASAPGPSHLEVTSLDGKLESCSAPDPLPVGRRVYITKATKTLLQMLSESAKTGRVPSSYEILTWMDAESPEVGGLYMDSYSDFKTLGVNDALDIMETDDLHLKTFGRIGLGGAIHLRQCTQDRILIPLGLWETESNSIDSAHKMLNLGKVVKWQNEVEEGYVEEIEDSSDIKVEVVDEVEDMEDMGHEESSGIEEVEGWWEEVNVGQWEAEI